MNKYPQNSPLWDVAQCSSCVNRCFGRTYRLHLQGRKIHERGSSVSRWLQTSLARGFFNLKMEAICSSETSVHTITTRRHIPENDILHIHRRENLKSYKYTQVYFRNSNILGTILIQDCIVQYLKELL
jgi:hypothetical protein